MKNYCAGDKLASVNFFFETIAQKNRIYFRKYCEKSCFAVILIYYYFYYCLFILLIFIYLFIQFPRM